MTQKRVVITGLGLVTPLGNDVATTWHNLLLGKSGAGAITHFDASKFKTHFACEVKDLDLSALLDTKELRRYDRYIHYAIKSAEEAILDAKIKIENEDPLRCGVIYGSGMGGVNALDVNIGNFGAGDGTPRYSPFFIPMIITNMASGMLAIRYGFKGVNYATTSACASSSHAIANACYQIRMGLADVILTGGSEAAVEPCGIGGFNALHALSNRNDSPLTASRPFSASRDGFVLGEGAGTLILEEYEHAKAMEKLACIEHCNELDDSPNFDGGECYESHSYIWYRPKDAHEIDLLNDAYGNSFGENMIGEWICVETDSGDDFLWVTMLDDGINHAKYILDKLGFDVVIAPKEYKLW